MFWLDPAKQPHPGQACPTTPRLNMPNNTRPGQTCPTTPRLNMPNHTPAKHAQPHPGLVWLHSGGNLLDRMKWHLKKPHLNPHLNPRCSRRLATISQKRNRPHLDLKKPPRACSGSCKTTQSMLWLLENYPERALALKKPPRACFGSCKRACFASGKTTQSMHWLL